MLPLRFPRRKRRRGAAVQPSLPLDLPRPLMQSHGVVGDPLFRRVATALSPTLAIAAAALAASCTNEPTEAPESDTGGFESNDVTCEPGEELGCMCNDGRAGVQLCAPSGHELGACECDAPGADDSSDTGEPTSDTDATTGASLCGNGVVDEDEQCDDGNTQYDDACNNECIAECGLTWERAIGRADDGSFATDVAVGPENSVAVVGVRQNDKDSDIWVSRFDADGTELWSETIDLGSDEGADAVAVDAEGNILVTATVRGENGRDIAVYVFNADGVEQWTDVHDGLTGNDDDGAGAAFDGNGNAIVSGTVRDADGDTDLWVRKYDASGQAQWTETYSGVGNGRFSTDRGGDVAVDGAGNVYAAVDVYVAFDETDVHLVKFAPDGGPPLWDFAPFAGAPTTDHTSAGLAVAANGDAVLGINNTVSAAAGWRYWVFKVDPDGAERWQVDSLDLVGEAHTLDGLGIDGTGRVGLGMTFAPSKTGFEAVTVALQSDGSRGCDSAIQIDGGNVIPQGATVDPSGNLFVAGLVQETGTTQQRWLARIRGAAALR